MDVLGKAGVTEPDGPPMVLTDDQTVSNENRRGNVNSQASEQKVLWPIACVEEDLFWCYDIMTQVPSTSVQDLTRTLNQPSSYVFIAVVVFCEAVNTMGFCRSHSAPIFDGLVPFHLGVKHTTSLLRI